MCTVNIVNYCLSFQSPCYRNKVLGIDDIALANIAEIYQGKHMDSFCLFFLF